MELRRHAQSRIEIAEYFGQVDGHWGAIMDNHIEQNQVALAALQATFNEWKQSGKEDIEGKNWVTGIGLIVINLEQQSARILSIAKDSRFDPELEGAAEQCEQSIAEISRLYDRLSNSPHDNDLKRKLLDDIDRLAKIIANLSTRYLALRAM